MQDTTPFKKLQIQKIGCITVEEIAINDELDVEFKPGLYEQTKNFLNNSKILISIQEQVRNLAIYNKINPKELT